MNIKTTFTLSVFSLCLLLSLNAPAIAQSTPEIAGFTLVRADTGATLLELPPDGATINLAQLPTRALNIRAVTAPAAVKKVAFTVNEKSTGTDSKDPYALYQRDGNRYASWTPQAGIYVVTATPYDAASGAPGMPQTLYLTVVDDASSAAPSPTPGPAATAEPTPEPQPTAAPELPASAQPEIAAFVLVRADTGETLAGPLPDTTEVDLCQLPVRTINVRALTTPELVKHVVFHINGTQVAADARAPYALYPRDGNRYKLWTPSPGSYHIRALPYDAVTGQSGSSRSFVLSVTDSCPPLPPPEPTPEATPQPAPSSSPSPMPSASPSPTPALPGIPVFPGAAGFGTRTPAGSGRHQTPPSAAIYRVNSLADRGSGTLRQCVEAAGARTCVFEVSGRIELASELRAVNPFLTIAGQTAPAPGILLSGGPLRIAAPEVLVQHLQVRAGDAVTGPNPASRDSVAVIAPSTPVYNVVLDHLSASWGIDENMSTGYPNVNDITFSNSIISEGLYDSIHPDGPHSKGLLVGDHNQRISVHHNLFAHNQDRNPRLNPGTSVEMINNVVYNWGGVSGWNVCNLADTGKTNNPVLLNFIGNYYKPGPSSPIVSSIYASPIAPLSRIFVLGNIGPTRPTDTGDEWAITALSSQYRAWEPALALSGVAASTADEAYQNVLSSAGSRPRESNPVDDRVRLEVVHGTGSLKDCVSGCTRAAGGYPEMEQNFRPFETGSDPFGDSDGDGYTNLEEILHHMALSVE